MEHEESNIEIKKKEYDKFVQNITNCQRCKDLVYSRQLYPWGKPVPGAGNLNAEIMFVGEAPGRFGAGTTGVPFTKDRSGVFFEKLLSAANLKPEDVYITNIVKCCPENNRTPRKDEVHNCFPWLIKEIDIVNPKIIVLMGKTAYTAFKEYYPDFKEPIAFKTFGISIARAFKVTRWFYFTYHPAYYLRTGQIPLAIKHFKYLRYLYEDMKRGETRARKD